MYGTPSAYMNQTISTKNPLLSKGSDIVFV
jgi:hypothetical protein